MKGLASIINTRKIHSFLNIKFVKDTSFTLISHFIVGISGLLINTVVGNHFGISNLGVINQGLSIYMILAIVSNFGIQTSAQKHTSQHADNYDLIKVIFSNAIIATLVSSVIVLLSYSLLLELFPNIIRSEILSTIVEILIYGVPLFAINKTINNFMTGLREMKIYSLVRLMRWSIVILIVIFIVVADLPFESIAYSYIFSETFILFFLCSKTRKYFGKIDFKWINKHLSFGIKSIMAEFVATFNTRVYILIIGYSLGDEAAGYYSYIEVFAFSLLMISAALQKNFNPLFTKLWYENNFPAIRSKMQNIFSVSSLIFLPILVGLYLFYYVYTKTMMTEDYLDYSLVLILLFAGVGLRFLFAPFFAFLIMANYLYANLLRVSIYAVINIILLMILVKPYGLIGASITYTISMVINILILHYLYKWKLNLNLFRILLNI